MRLFGFTVRDTIASKAAFATSGVLDNGVVWRHKTHPRRTKLSLVVLPSGEVEIRTPVGVTSKQAEVFLTDNAAWAKQKSLAATQGQADDRIRFFSEAVALRTGRGPARISSGVIITPDETHLERFLRSELSSLIGQRWDVWLPMIEAWDVPQPSWTLRKMRSRWGSCSVDGRIRFSTMLVHQAVEQIDYVIVHELCHLKEMNHSPAYWRLVESMMPDWRERRARLSGC
jgi:hypothetical protein